jgi:hypothetical protein
MNELSVLNATGDTKIVWDDNDEAARANARAEVARLKAAGYVFFLVDGTDADEVAAGKGELVARFVSAEELTDPAPDEPAETASSDAADSTTAPKRRGRPPGPNRKAVAVRPLRGG